MTLNVSAGSGSADLELAIAHTATPDPTVAGKPIVFAVKITNHSGTTNVSGVTVSLEFSSGVTISTTSAGWSCSGSGPFTCTLSGNLNANTSSTLTVNVLTTNYLARSVTALASVSSSAADPGLSSNIGFSTAQQRIHPLARPNLVPMIP